MKESRQGFCRREGKVVPCRGAEDGKGLGINSGKTVMRNPETETESMRRRAESTRGCVNLNTVTKKRRSSARDTFIAESTVFPLCIILCRIGSLEVDKYLLFYKDIYLPVTLKCTQKFVLETFHLYRPLTIRDGIGISHE